MERNRLKEKIKLTVTLLCASVLLVWGIFYLYIAGGLRRSNEENMQRVSQQVIDRLEQELLGLERLAFTLGQNASVRAFVAEGDALLYHEKSGAVDALVSTLTGSRESPSSLILFSSDRIYSRFIGSLGNTAVERIGIILAAEQLPYYAALTLEGVPYICYAAAIHEEGEQLGAVALLIEEEQLLGLFTEYFSGDSLQISLASGGTVVTSNVKALIGESTQMLQTRSALNLSRSIGFAPFEIYVTLERGYLSVVYKEFAITAVITTAIFLGLLAVFMTIAGRHFFRPMLSVVRDVESLGITDDARSLQKTGEETFDSLVDQINRMLLRLDEKNQALMDANSRLQTAELERQRSLVISLKKQINAHFTVNVLNIIKVLSEQGETDKAAEMSDGLSQMLRYAHAGDEFIGGMEEFFVLRKYVAIMQIRYQNRFCAEFDWDDRLVDVQMPRMLVQPLLENAIVHGFVSGGCGTITVSGRVAEEEIVLSVQDDGRGIDARELARLKKRIGLAQTPVWDVGGVTNIALANIQRRIWSYYGEGYGLEISSAPGSGTTVTLTFPAHCDLE